MKNKNWSVINRKKVYDGTPYINLFIDTVKLPNGKIIDDYHRIEVNNAVMLLVENDKDELLVYNEYRHGIGEISYTFPAGGIENEESLEEASKREMLEELGCSIEKCFLLKKYVVSGSYMFSELNIMSIKGVKKICEPTEVDIENPELIWLSKDLVREAVIESKFKGLTYATCALIWLFYNEKK